MTRVSVITPTADQPLGMRLAEIYMRRQTVQPYEWIVADDGEQHATLTLNQTHIKLKRVYKGGQSLANNLLTALTDVSGDVIVIWEHDDWYAPNHLEICLKHLANAKLVGADLLRYYNIPNRMYITMRNRGSALCNTALSSDLLETLKDAALSALDSQSYGIDNLLWQSVPNSEKKIHSDYTVIGMKGLPGRPGLGVGHRPKAGHNRRWHDDPSYAQLRSWVGEDSQYYLGASYGSDKA